MDVLDEEVEEVEVEESEVEDEVTIPIHYLVHMVM